MTTVFQNGERFRTGKLQRQSSADFAIRWLLDAYKSMQVGQENLLVIPVNISCDRIYESKNLATEMINGEKEGYTWVDAFQKLVTM